MDVYGSKGWGFESLRARKPAGHRLKPSDCVNRRKRCRARRQAVATLLGTGHELPVPGNPAITDRITRTAVEALLADPTTTAGSLRGFYAVFDLIALALAAAAGYGLARTVQLIRAPRRHRRVLRDVLWTMATLALGVAVLALPSVTGYGWAGAWTWAPDLALVVFTFGFLVMATGLLRLFAVARPPPAAEVPSPGQHPAAGPIPEVVPRRRVAAVTQHLLSIPGNCVICVSVGQTLRRRLTIGRMASCDEWLCSCPCSPRRLDGGRRLG